MMTRRESTLIRLSLSLCLMLAVSHIVSAEIPAKINYQVRLSDAGTREALAGPHELAFRIYDAQVQGTELWAETQTLSADSAGVISAVLGTLTPIEIGFEGPTWLEVEVDGEVLSPRREIVSVPYAFTARAAGHASDADSLGGLAAGAYVLRGEAGSITADMIVGGTGSGLDADMLDSLDAAAFADTGHIHDRRYYTQDSLANPGFVNDPANPVDWTKLKNVPAGFADGTDDGEGGEGDGHSLDADDGDPVDALYVDAEGDVGIGTETPGEKLEIAGTARMEGFLLPTGADSGLVLTSDSSGVGTWQAPIADGHSLDADGGLTTDVVYVENTGDVGIGTLEPTSRLHIYDDANAQVGITIENPNTGVNSAERISFRDENGDVTGIATTGPDYPGTPNALKIFNNRPGGSIRFTTGGGAACLRIVGSKVGVGFVDPTERLSVDGTLKTSGFLMPTDAADGYVLKSDATGLGSWQPAAVGDGHSLDAMDGDPVDALFVDNDGDVGIGPGLFSTYARLHIREDVNDPVEVKIQNLDTGPQSAERIIFSDENGDMAMITTYDDGALQLASTLEIANSRPGGNIQLRTEGQTMAFVNKTGIGIGMPIPKKKLHISAGATGLSYGLKLENSYSTSATGILFKTGSGIEDRGKGGIVYELTSDWNRGDFHILQNARPDTTAANLSDAAVTIKNDGTVGIGTAEPEATLHIHETGLAGSAMAITNSGTGSGSGNGLTMGISNGGLAIISNHEQNGLQFETHGNTAMVLDEYGRLSVGGLTGFNDNLHLHNRTPGAGCFMRVTSASIGHTESDGLLVGMDNLGKATLYSKENASMWFGTNDLVRMTLAANGDLGIGTSVPATDLHVHRNGSNSSFALLTNGTTGSTISDGLRIGVNSSGNGFIRQGENGYLSILTNGTERMRVAPDGMVGIGEDNPSNLLDIKGSSPYLRLNTTGTEAALKLSKNDATKWQLGWNEGSGYVYFWGGGGAGTSLVIEDATGEVGIGTSTPGYLLDVSGTCHASSFPTSSDARFKENVEQVTGALDKLTQIRGVAFDWNERYEALGRSTGHREIGVIAQEVEAVFPEIVTTWGDEAYRAVDYGRLTGVLIEAVKELKAENESLRQRIDALEQASN